MIVIRIRVNIIVELKERGIIIISVVLLTKCTPPPPFLPQGLNQHWDDLCDLTKRKKLALDGAHQVHKFIR